MSFLGADPVSSKDSAKYFPDMHVRLQVALSYYLRCVNQSSNDHSGDLITYSNLKQSV